MKDHLTFFDHTPAAFTLIAVEGGTFEMGSNDYKREQPIHPVELSPYYLGKYPVTQALWQQVMGDNPSYFKQEDHPVDSVSWFEAVVFCNALSDRLGLRLVYYNDPAFQHPFGKKEGQFVLENKGQVHRHLQANGLRLPTEAEWEYAARGGKQSKGYRYAGGDKLKELGWYDDNSHKETKPVGLKLGNELGLHDLSGNVWEWCEDWYDGDYYQACFEKGTVLNPTGPAEGTFRVLCGGSCFLIAEDCRTAHHSVDRPGGRYGNFGFRLACSVPAV